eukprot:2059886-Amphidinium_carterae.1
MVLIPCGYAKCRNHGLECKNRGQGLSLPVAETIKKQIRENLRSDATIVKFCCQKHLELSKGKRSGMAAKEQRGGRIALDERQSACLFAAALSIGAPWLAVLTLMQMSLGERASCASQVRFG